MSRIWCILVYFDIFTYTNLRKYLGAPCAPTEKDWVHISNFGCTWVHIIIISSTAYPTTMWIISSCAWRKCMWKQRVKDMDMCRHIQRPHIKCFSCTNYLQKLWRCQYSLFSMSCFTTFSLGNARLCHGVLQLGHLHRVQPFLCHWELHHEG